MRTQELIMVTLLLSSCTRYRPVPLDDDPSLLHPLDVSVLLAETASIDRPYLAPTTVDLSQPFTPYVTALIALLRNADLVAARTRAKVADAQLFDAGLIPDPIIGFSIDHVVSGPPSVASNAFGTQIVQDLRALQNRRVRVQSSLASAQQVRLDLAWLEWQTVGQVKVLAVRNYYLGVIADLAEAGRRDAEALLQRSLRAAARGDYAPDQAQIARLAALDATERSQTAHLSLVQSHLDLRQTMGLPPNSDFQISPPTRPSPPPSFDVLFELARHQRLDLLALKAGYQSQESLVHQAVLDQFPSLNIGLSLSRDNSDSGFVGGIVEFVLPTWNRNRGKIAIERANRAVLKAEYEARLFQTRADLARATATLSEVFAQRRRLVADLPTLQNVATLMVGAAQRGDVAGVDALTAKQSLRDKQVLLAGLEQAIAEQSIALEVLTGTPRGSWPE